MIAKARISRSAAVLGFLHRTMRDFLRTNILPGILGVSRSEAFDVSLLLCKSFIAQIESLSEISSQKYFLLLLNQFLLYAGNLEAERKESPTALLDELDRSVGILLQTELRVLFLRVLFFLTITGQTTCTMALRSIKVGGKTHSLHLHSSKVFDSMPKRKLSKNRSSYLQSKDVQY